MYRMYFLFAAMLASSLYAGTPVLDHRGIIQLPIGVGPSRNGEIGFVDGALKGYDAGAAFPLRAPSGTVTSIYAGSGVSLDGGPTGNVTVSATGTVVGATAPLTISSGNVSLTYDPSTVSVTNSKLSLKQIVTGSSQGSASSIPVLTIDNYGRVTSLSAATASTTDSLATATYAGITRLSWPPVSSVDPIACSDNDPRLPRYSASSSTANSQSFAYTGSDQSWVVPAGVYLIEVKAWGAGGAGGTAGAGGGGGYSFDLLSVTPGTTVTVKVGRGGQINSGDGALYGEGGHSVQSGGGGGYAMVTNGTWSLYAGGGGGGAGNWGYGATAGGAGGGSSGVAGVGYGGGGPGTQSGVGAGGLGVGGPGNPGVAHHGGNDTVYGRGVGAGGGGYYGGGSGGIDTGIRYGGGGGSGYVVTGFGVTTAGSGQTPGNSSDPDRAGMGDGGAIDVVGDHGAVKISWSSSYALSYPSLIFLGPTSPTTNGQVSFDGSQLQGYDAGSVFPLRTTVTLTPSGGLFVNGVQTAQSGATFNVSTASTSTDNVVAAVNTSTTQISNSGWADIASLSVSITPASASNKVLVTATLSVGSVSGARFQLVRDSTAIGIGDAGGSRTRVTASIGATGSDGMSTVSFSWLDSPATTSATTYKVQGMIYGGSVSWLNRSANDTDDADNARASSSIIAREIRQ